MGLKGLTEMTRKLEKLLLQQVPAKVSQDVRDISFYVSGESMMKAPVKTGHLKESGYVLFNDVQIAKGNKQGTLEIIGSGPDSIGDQITAKIGFNATTPDGKYSYALIQHERTDFNHPLGGGEAKYLEKAMVEGIDRYQKTIARELMR